MKKKKSWLKKIGGWKVTQELFGLLLSLYARFVYLTNRWTIEGLENIKPYWDSKRPLVVCFWHGRMVMMVYMWPSLKPILMFQSQHRDSRLMVSFIRHFKLKAFMHDREVHDGKARAFLALRRHLLKGGAVGITPDGPKGPRYQVKRGVVALAIKSKCDIIPGAYSCSRGRFLRSWDRFFVGLPFGRGAFVYGKPLSPEAYDLDEKRLQQAVEEGLKCVTMRADDLCGLLTPL